jgi:uncharacterized membrane protein
MVAMAPAASAGTRAGPTYQVEILPPLPGHDSLFPADMNDGGVITGIAGTDPFDPLATPVEIAPRHFAELSKPTDSVNFALGIGRADLVTGSSSNQPFAWVRGVPVPLPPVNGLPSGFGWDANRRGVIVGEVFSDFTGRQFPVAWPTVDGPGFTLEGLGASPNGVAFAINERGQVAGDSVGGDHPFVGVRWDRPRQEPLQIGPLPGAVNSEAVALNELGDVVGRSSFGDGTVEAILYVEETGS